MKKLSIVIAMLLVVALAVPALANPFTDVPANHWAYEEVNKAVAAGIIDGYPDGTFKGQNNLTRYEMAKIVAEILDNLNALANEVESVQDGLTPAMEAEVEEIASNLVKRTAVDLDSLKKLSKLRFQSLKKEIEVIKEGLTVEMADDVDAIVQELMKKNSTDIDSLKKLSKLRFNALKAEVQSAVEKLTEEFRPELKKMGKLEADLGAAKSLAKLRYNSLVNMIGKVENRVIALEEKTANVNPAVAISGSYAIDYRETTVYGSGTPYVDPFDKDFEDDGTEELLDVADEFFKQTATIGLDVEKDNFTADLDFAGVVNNFGLSDGVLNDVTVSGTVSGPDFVATVGEGQVANLAPYLFDATDADADGVVDAGYQVNGIIATVKDNNTFVLSNSNAVTDGVNIFAGKNGFTLADQYDVNVLYGMEGMDKKVVGVNAAIPVAGFTITPEFAFSDEKLQEKYFTVNVAGDVGPIAATFNYKDINGIQPIAATVSDTKGYDIGGTMSQGPVDLSATYSDYGNANVDLSAAIVEDNALDVGGFDFYGDVAYSTYNEQVNSNRTTVNVNAVKEQDPLTVTGTVNYDNYTAQYYTDAALDLDNTGAAGAETFDKILDIDYVASDALTVGANYLHDASGALTQTYTADYVFSDAITAGAELVYDTALSQTYTVDFVKGIVSAGVVAEVGVETTVTAGLDPEAIEVASVSLDPSFSYGTQLQAQKSNMVARLDATKEVNDSMVVSGAFEYADKEYGVDMTGTKVTKEVAMTLDITDDVAANANYSDLDFIADNAADSYNVKIATAGVSFGF